MNFLVAESISKFYGERTLFENIDFSLNSGDKIALIAKNGAGKTSFLDILTKNEAPDGGKVLIQKDTSMGYLTQNPDLPSNSSVLDVVLQEDNPVMKAIKQYEAVLLMPHDDMLFANKLQEATDIVESLNGWDFEQRMKTILTKLGIEDLTKKIRELSGGQKKRVALAKILIQQPNIMILDEPTNHLDIEMVEWLEGYLASSVSSLLLVTHDRYFLDRITTHIIELDGGILHTYNGDYEYYLEKKQERIFNQGREIDKAKNIYRTEIEWIRKQPKARGTKSKSRVDAFYELEKKAKTKIQDAELNLEIKMSRVGGKILELKHINKKFQDNILVKGFSYTFNKGDRIGIIGKNGAGKSTFLNILTEKILPDSGKINKGDTTVFGYYEQETIQADPTRRVIEIVKDIADIIPIANGDHLTATQFLLYFGFTPEVQFTPVGKLSGGEKRRLLLMTVLMKNPNFLILDEPTNDLDLPTLSTLEEFLLTFPGVLLIVSHDRYFMDKLVNQLFIFEGEGEVSYFNGNYSEYRSWKSIEDEKKKNDKSYEKDTSNSLTSAPVVVTDVAPTHKRKLSFKEQKELDNIEEIIKKREEEKLSIETQMSEGIDDYAKINSMGKQLSDINKELETLTHRWMELSE